MITRQTYWQRLLNTPALRVQRPDRRLLAELGNTDDHPADTMRYLTAAFRLREDHVAGYGPNVAALTASSARVLAADLEAMFAHMRQWEPESLSPVFELPAPVDAHFVEYVSFRKENGYEEEEGDRPSFDRLFAELEKREVCAISPAVLFGIDLTLLGDWPGLYLDGVPIAQVRPNRARRPRSTGRPRRMGVFDRRGMTPEESQREMRWQVLLNSPASTVADAIALWHRHDLESTVVGEVLPEAYIAAQGDDVHLPVPPRSCNFFAVALDSPTVQICRPPVQRWRKRIWRFVHARARRLSVLDGWNEFGTPPTGFYSHVDHPRGVVRYFRDTVHWERVE